MEIVITSNSPGEVAAWVKPVVKRLKKEYPKSNISVFLPPCVFASGSEKEVLAEYPEIDNVYGKKEYLGFALLGKKPSEIDGDKQGIVVFLGGDLFHAKLLGKKLDFPVVAYTEGDFNWQDSIKRFMVPDQRTKDKLVNKGADANQVVVIGNLMVDAVDPNYSSTQFKDLLNINDQTIITLFPGSRPHEVEYMLPFFLETVSNLACVNNNLKFLLSKSSFVSNNQLEDIFNDYLQQNKEDGQFIEDKDKIILKLRDKFEVEVYSKLQYDLMQITDLALTIPGTNTLEMSVFGTPMVVVLPLNKPEKIPLTGVAGMIAKVPILGPLVMKYAIAKLQKKIDFVALPNMITNKEIVPEIIGVLESVDLIIAVEELLQNKKKREEMHQELIESVGAKGAAAKLVEVIAEVLASSLQNKHEVS